MNLLQDSNKLLRGEKDRLETAVRDTEAKVSHLTDPELVSSLDRSIGIWRPDRTVPNSDTECNVGIRYGTLWCARNSVLWMKW